MQERSLNVKQGRKKQSEPVFICKLTGWGESNGRKPSSAVHSLEYVWSCMCARVSIWERIRESVQAETRRVNNGLRAAQMWYIKWHISYLRPPPTHPPTSRKINGWMPGRIPNERWINVIYSFVYWNNLTALAHNRKYLSGFFSQDNIDLR